MIPFKLQANYISEALKLTRLLQANFETKNIVRINMKLQVLV